MARANKREEQQSSEVVPQLVLRADSRADFEILKSINQQFPNAFPKLMREFEMYEEAHREC